MYIYTYMYNGGVGAVGGPTGFGALRCGSVVYKCSYNNYYTTISEGAAGTGRTAPRWRSKRSPTRKITWVSCHYAPPMVKLTSIGW